MDSSKLKANKIKKSQNKADIKINSEISDGDYLLLSVEYNGKKRKAVANLLDKKNLIKYYDTTDHLPYLISNLSIQEIETKYPKVKNHLGFVKMEPIRLKNLIVDKDIEMTKVIANDPLSIGGKVNSIREYLKGNSWEDKIRYHNCYIYDNGLIPGLFYNIADGKLIKKDITIPNELKKEINDLFVGENEDFLKNLPNVFELFFTPIPKIRRLAFDIEVEAPENRIPDPNETKNQVTCISFIANDGFKKVLLLEREGSEEGEKIEGFNVEIKKFKEERELLLEAFNIIDNFPVVLTFNGDNFDLKYLYNRATKIFGIPRDSIPIYLGREIALLRNGIHIDLYKFFHNRAIQFSAFRSKYRQVSLNEVSKALLGSEKIELENFISDLTNIKLAYYCFHDSELTLELTQFNNNLVMDLIILLMRISKLSMEDVTRQGISSWLQNLFYFEHRQRGYLIPNPEYILAMKGEATSKAIIKGKKYQGAIVINPIPGIFFNVVVLDFASLYPSVIQRNNLSYETINCPHPECKSNLLPNTKYWVCTKRVGLSALVIGLLKELRVKWFKDKAKDKNLSPQERDNYNVIQFALKVIVNAAYGVFGFSNFPLYCPPVADATTAGGRFAIEEAIKKSEELGVKVLYGDSILGSRCVVVKKDGLVDILPIKDLWNICEQEVIINHGKEVKIPNSMYTLSKDGKWQKIKQIIRHKTKKRIFRINQKNGETICTEDHSIISENFREVKPTELGDKKILSLSKIPVDSVKTPEVIDLYPLVKKFRFKTQHKGSEKINEWHANKDSLWFGWTEGKNQLKIKRNCKLSDLCKLLGIYIADGNSSFYHEGQGNKAGCGISSSNIDFLNEIKKLWEKIDINHEIEIIRTTKGTKKLENYEYEDKTHRIQINSTTWTAFFISLCGSGSENKHLPSFIYNVEEKYQKLLYESYLFGDGRVEQGKNSFTTKSLHLVSGLCYLLKSWGIDTAIFYDEKKDVYRVWEREKANDSMHPIKTKIQKLNNKERYVYDLSVENSEMFVDACGMLLLHNTDSVFLHNPTKEQIDELIKWSKDKLEIDLDVEKTFRWVALSDRKKNYLGVYPNGDVDVKGLSGKKSNTPLFIQDLFYNMIKILSEVKKREDIQPAKEKIKKLVKTALSKLKKKTYSLEDLSFRVVLTRQLDKYKKTTPQHVKAARQLERYYENNGIDTKMQPGDVIFFVKTKTNDGVKPKELARLTDIDTDKYKKAIESTFDQVLDALGIPFEELIGIRTLDFFMK